MDLSSAPRYYQDIGSRADAFAPRALLDVIAELYQWNRLPFASVVISGGDVLTHDIVFETPIILKDVVDLPHDQVGTTIKAVFEAVGSEQELLLSLGELTDLDMKGRGLDIEDSSIEEFSLTQIQFARAVIGAQGFVSRANQVDKAPIISVNQRFLIA